MNKWTLYEQALKVESGAKKTKVVDSAMFPQCLACRLNLPLSQSLSESEFCGEDGRSRSSPHFLSRSCNFALSLRPSHVFLFALRQLISPGGDHLGKFFYAWHVRLKCVFQMTPLPCPNSGWFRRYHWLLPRLAQLPRVACPVFLQFSKNWTHYGLCMLTSTSTNVWLVGGVKNILTLAPRRPLIKRFSLIKSHRFLPVEMSILNFDI